MLQIIFNSFLKAITGAALQLIIAGSNIIMISPITTFNNLMLKENKAKMNTNGIKIIHTHLSHLCIFILVFI